MIIRENLEENPGLVKYYSDTGMLIRKVGTEEIYGEAVELATTAVEYEETDIPIEEPESSEDSNAEISQEAALDMKRALEILNVKP